MVIRTLGLICAATFIWQCTPGQPTLHCQITVDFSHVPELFDIELEWDTLALQLDGKPLGPNPPNGHGVLLDPTWTELPIALRKTIFKRSDSRPISVYETATEPMQVGRAWPRALTVSGRLASGKEVIVESILEPITVKFPLVQGQKATLHIELVVMRNLGNKKGTYAVYTKRAYWSEGLSAR